MKRFDEMGDAELAAALSTLRPEPSPAFAAELDQRAAAGFPRRSPRPGPNPFTAVLAWLGGGTKWRLLIPAGGLAVAAIAVATIVVVGANTGGSSDSASGGGTLGLIQDVVPRAQEQTAGAAGSTEQSAPKAQAAPSHNFNSEFSLKGRDVERAAQIVIGTKPGEVGEAAAQVFETVHQYDGIVLSSTTENGSGTEAEASFELLIPSGKVGDAMAAFSRIGEVVNRHETTNDITAPTVGASERLQDSQARIEGLLTQLSDATTESEREVVEAELAGERRHAADLKSKLANLHQRANLSRVTVRIVSGNGAVTPGGSDGDESWGIGSALDDAGHLLSVAAGVTIVGLAVLAPLLLLLVLAWLAGRAWTRRARERALT